MRSADDITAMWKAWNIKPDQQFHSTAAPAGARPKPLCTHAPWVGEFSVYDGGWYEWSSDPKNLVATGERGPGSSK